MNIGNVWAEALGVPIQEDIDAAAETRRRRTEALNAEFGPSFKGFGSLKYPYDMVIGKESDYVKFRFYEYKPPFARGSEGGNTLGSNYQDYNQNYDENEIDGNFGDDALGEIKLFMPQDVSTSYGAEWGGKEISNFGAGSLSAVTNIGRGDFGAFLDNLGAGIASVGALPVTAGAALTKKALEMARTNMTVNDVLGGTSGVILNPNMELFFSGHKVRNFGLKFKMSARTSEEAHEIHEICQSFKIHSLPQFGGTRNQDREDGVGSATEAANFIKVPNLVKMEFMKGPDKHPFLTQYKAMALTNVDINYTPDGAYSTLIGGFPTAVELSIAMVETKLVYQNDFTGADRNWSY